MTDAALLLGAWVSVPLFAAGAAALRERHERRFPDCVVCRAQKGPSDAQNRPSERRTAAL